MELGENTSEILLALIGGERTSRENAHCLLGPMAKWAIPIGK
jgi:hypothetical protein